MKKKVLFIVYYDLGLGGVQKKIVDIAKYFDKYKQYKKLKVYVILDGQRKYDLKEDLFFQEVRNTKVKILQKPQLKFHKLKFPLSLYVLWKTLILKPDIILGFMRRFSIIAILMKMIFYWRSIRVVVSFDNVPSLYLPISVKKKYKLMLWEWLIKVLYPKADFVIVPSNTAKEDMVNNYQIPYELIGVNKNWVVKFGSTRNTKPLYDLIYIGRVDPVKNLDRFVRVVKSLKKIHPKIKTCVVGWGNDAERIKDTITINKLSSTIEMVGTKLHKDNYLSKSKIYLLTTKFEGLPIAALEAMAYGIPVVSTDYPGASEFIINKETGFLCSSNKQFVESINYLLNNDKKRQIMGQRAKDFVKKNHSRKVLEDFLKMIGL